MDNIKQLVSKNIDYDIERNQISKKTEGIEFLNKEIQSLIELKSTSSISSDKFKKQYEEKTTLLNTLKSELDVSSDELAYKVKLKYRVDVLNSLIDDKSTFGDNMIYRTIIKLIYVLSKTEILVVISVNHDGIQTLLSKTDEILKYKPFLEKTYFNKETNQNLYVKAVIYGQ